jgi:hypothetical protein
MPTKLRTAALASCCRGISGQLIAPSVSYRRDLGSRVLRQLVHISAALYSAEGELASSDRMAEPSPSLGETESATHGSEPGTTRLGKRKVAIHVGYVVSLDTW